VISIALEDEYKKTIDNKGIKDGKYCNIFDKNDCIDINGKTISVTIGKAPKVYIPESQIDTEFTK
jgi:hypothetical protein